MKKKRNYLILFVFLALIVVSLFVFIKPVKQAVVGSSGDSYYDERCIDVSQYYSQGYVNVRLDTHGCQIVGISRIVAQQNIGTFQNCWGNVYNRVNGGTTTYDPCEEILGPDWVGGCEDVVGNTKGTVLCSLYGFDEKGGFERVLNYCTYDAGDILVAESFVGPKTITKYDLRYPIKAFCRAHPSIVTTGLTSYTSTNIPQDLIDGKSVSINSGDTLTVFYVINNVYNLPDKCVSSDNLALDVNSSVCKSTLGFTYLCSEGVWDALTGSCTVMRTAECGANERLTVNSDGSKVCLYNPPIQVECPDGFTYDASQGYCYRVADSVNLCSAPYVLFEPSQVQCTGLGGTWQLCPQCPVDKICSQSICSPICSVGVECRYSPSVITECVSGVLSNGKCILQNNETLIVCPTESNWDSVNEVCVKIPSVSVKCLDGSSPVNNVCYAIPDGYTKCPTTQILSNGKCVSMSDLAVVTPLPSQGSNFIWIYIIVILVVLIIILILTKFKKSKR